MPDSSDRDAENASNRGEVERISSESLAALVIDALLCAGLLAKADVEEALRIAAEEIEVRKAMGDY